MSDAATTRYLKSIAEELARINKSLKVIADSTKPKTAAITIHTEGANMYEAMERFGKNLKAATNWEHPDEN